MKIFDMFSDTHHKELGILRKVIIILGFLPSFVGGFLGGAMVLLSLLMLSLTASVGESGFGYLPNNLSAYNLLLVFGMFLMEIFAIAKMGKKKSKMFSVSMISIALYFLFDSFNISEKIINVFGKYTTAEGFSLAITILLFLIPLGLSVCFFIAGTIHNKSNTNQSAYIKIGIIIILLMIVQGILNGLDSGKWLTATITQIGMFSSILLYIIFYPKGYIMPKYQKTNESISTNTTQSPNAIVSNPVVTDNMQKNSGSVASELERLKVLLDSGAISQEEFLKLKSNIIEKSEK